MIKENTTGVQVNEFFLQPCTTKEDLSEVTQLRYTAYRNVNAIAENSEEKFQDAYDSAANAKSCLVYEDDKLVASLRACVYSAELNYLPIPAFEVYKNDIEKAIGLDKTIVESNRFVISPDKMDSKLLFKIPFRFIILNLKKFDGDYIITAVREKHIPLYKRFLCMEPISGLQKYPGIDVEMVLMAGDCRKYLQNVIDKEEFFSISEEEINSYSL
jgi:hypothetical protein